MVAGEQTAKIEEIRLEMDQEQVGDFQAHYLTGWRLQAMNISMCLSLFLASLESTIVSTALVSITNSLNGFQRSSWVVTAYLLTYTGFLIVFAKLSDTFGRKTMMILSLVIFIAFSIGCGLARSMTELIILRAFQGIGGGGIATMVFVILPENISPAEYPMYAAIVSSVLAFSSLLGPILGGLICETATWRWVFLLNPPPACVALALVALSVPSSPSTKAPLLQKLRKVDFIGAFLVLSTTILFVTALEQGGTGFPWKSAVVLTLFILSIFLAAACLIWARKIARTTTTQEPVLAWNLLTDRFCVGLFLNAFFMGAAFLSTLIVLPQQFQVVFQDSPAVAGYRLLCVTLVSPLFSGLAGFLMQKKSVPPLYILLGGMSLAVLGCGLASSVPQNTRKPPWQEYLYQALMGAGFGFTLSTVIMAAPLAFAKKDMGIGTVNQARALGMSIGVSLCANILSSTLSSAVEGQLSQGEFKAVMGSAEAVTQLPPALQGTVRRAFSMSFTRQMQAVCGLAAAGLLCTLIMVEKRPRFQATAVANN